MKKGNLKRVLPYETDYNLLSLCRKWESFGLWMIGILSIILPIFGAIPECTNLDIFYSTLKFLYFIAIIAYYILDIYTETFLYPATARKRRKGFIDNSLGSKYLEKSVEGYYTNDRRNGKRLKKDMKFPNRVYAVESVLRGHPDKICDQISDGLLDQFLKTDPDAHTAIECLGTKGTLVVAGEVSSTAILPIEQCSQEIYNRITGYSGLKIINLLSQQSPQLAKAVINGGAGDQGVMYGYACDNHSISDRRP